MSASSVTEEARERETFRYDSSLINQVFPNASDGPLLSSKLAPDPALTAFAELAVLRLNASRALVSLFDRENQYIVAEATQSTPLSTEPCENQHNVGRDGLGTQLLLWGTALPRPRGLCENVLIGKTTDAASEQRLGCEKDPPHNLPVTVVGDLNNHPSNDGNRVTSSWPPYGFYAGVPLRTPRGIDIGVFCVLDLEPRENIDASVVPIMQDVSRTIMGYLETRRFRDGQRRADMMVRGVGNFLQKSMMTGWAATAHDENPAESGKTPMGSNSQDIANGVDGPSDNRSEPASLAANSTPKIDKRIHMHDASITADDKIISNAAKIIREAIEADGVVFLDASISSFGGRTRAGPIPGTHDNEWHSSSTGAHNGSGMLSKNGACCKVLGYSMFATPDNVTHDQEQLCQLPERVLKEFLDQYPRGTILILNEDEGMNANHEVSESEDSQPEQSDDGQSGSLQQHRGTLPTPASGSQPQDCGLDQYIKEMLPEARNVAFFPLWDTQKRRWYTAGFAFTKKSSRIFSVEPELSYLLAFGTIMMAEVLQAGAKDVERSKMDVLSSISHELRSPLHGIILGAELLHDTALDAFQGDLLHSMETCSRTLLDTVDHLLDWSGVNNFLSEAPVPQNNGDVEERGLRSGNTATIESGMMNIISRVNVDLIVEEVVESVYAGRIFQLRTLGSGNGQNVNHSYPGVAPSEDLDGNASQRESDIATICIDIEPNASWAFHTEPGALRRVVMNLVSNSLKFTSKGFVKVSLDQPQDCLLKKEHGDTLVRITVTDSGCGIGKSYLEGDIFTPFSQEDGLKPGMGLGLSFVERIVTALKGSISIESVLDKGTMVSVTVPLTPAVPDSATPKWLAPTHEFDAQRSDLRGLRVLLLGFRDTPSIDTEGGVFGTNVVERDGIANICRDWLQMQVVDPSDNNTLVPDLVLCDESYVHLNAHLHSNKAASSAPAVVICRNAVSARRLAEKKAYKHGPNGQLWEFSAQPVGPRKLAKILALTFKRWSSYQATMNPIASPAVQTPEDEQGHQIGEDDKGILEVAIPRQKGPDSPGSYSGLQEFTFPERVRRSTPLTPVSSGEQCNGSDAETELPGTSFLLVDDNPINLKILTTYMKKLRLPYRTATNGQQAVKTFGEGGGLYRCVFMDISMPVMDGFEATRHIRAIEMEKGLHRCTIFALTGLASADAQQEAFTSGIDLFLTKPVKLAELSQILSARNLAR